MTVFYSLLLLSIIGIIYLYRTKSVISLTITDLAVFAFLFYSLLHIGAVQHFRCDPFVWFKWGNVLLVYLFFRRLKKPRAVLYAIVLYGLLQSLVAIGQSLSLLPGSHRFFAITGTIGNPGPLGGFLVVALVCSVALLRQTIQKKKSRWIVIDGFFTVFLITGLLLTDSCAAFLSALAGLLIVCGDKIWNRFRKHKMTVLLSFAGVIGRCLLIAVFIAGFAGYLPNLTSRSLKAGLTAFIVFSLFSYPVVLFELLLLPVAFLGTLASQPVCVFRISRWIKMACISLLMGAGVFSIVGMNILHTTFEEIKWLTVSDAPVSTPYCERYFSVFVYNAGFNTAYKILSQPVKVENTFTLQVKGEMKRYLQIFSTTNDFVP